jgi:hypothetical protein
MRPNLDQQREYLFQISFGVRGSELDRFVSRAYRDMNRTFGGIGKLDANIKKNNELKTTVLNDAKAKMKECFNGLRKKHPPKDQVKRIREFDAWHSSSCKALIAYYGTVLRPLKLDHLRLTYGQAQKWLNMTMKYCWVCGSTDLDWLVPWFPSAHVPVDEVILLAVEKEGALATRPCKKWSKWNSENEYQDFQMELRKAAAARKESPLEMELRWWAKYRAQVTGGDKGD